LELQQGVIKLVRIKPKMLSKISVLSVFLLAWSKIWLECFPISVPAWFIFTHSLSAFFLAMYLHRTGRAIFSIAVIIVALFVILLILLALKLPVLFHLTSFTSVSGAAGALFMAMIL
jgi:hypothetical protein